MDTLWRLVWALPLVLVTGFAAMLVLKRFMAASPPATRDIRRLTLRESLTLSEESRLHLIEVDRETYLIIESSRHAALQSIRPPAGEATHLPHRFAPPWVRRFYKGRAR